MIWLLLLGFIFVILLDAYSDGDLDNIIKKVREWLEKPLFSKEKKQDK